MSYEDLINFYNDKNYHGWAPMLEVWAKNPHIWVDDTRNYEKYLKRGSVLILGCGVGGQVWGWL